MKTFEEKMTCFGAVLIIIISTCVLFIAYTMNSISKSLDTDLSDLPLGTPGKELLFVDLFSIYLISPDGTPQLISTQAGSEPSWSPDGKQIAFSSDSRSQSKIYVMNADGSNLQQITFGLGNDRAPTWSPDGTQIAFSSNRHNNEYKVYTMKADGSDVKQITFGRGNDQTPVWSPNGMKLAFSSDRGRGDYKIYIMNTNGSDIRQITFGIGDERTPAWSPDGMQIAFSSFVQTRSTAQNIQPDDYEIFVVNVGNSQTQRLTFLENFDTDPTWSTDGSQIAFSCEGQNTASDLVSTICVMDANGKNLRRVEERWRGTSPVWRPSSSP